MTLPESTLSAATVQTRIRKRIVSAIVNYLSSLRQFSRNARLYLLGSFLMGVNFHTFQLLLNLYLKETGLAEGAIGSVISSRAVGMTLMALPAAIVFSRTRLKPALVVVSLLFALFSLGLIAADSVNMLRLASALTGGAFAFLFVASGPFFMRNSSKVERTHLFAASFGVMILAGMIGSLGAGNMVDMLGRIAGNAADGYRYTMAGAIGLGLLSIIPFSLIKSSRPSKEESTISLSLKQFRSRWRHYFRFSFANFLLGMGAGLIIPFLNLYFKDRFHQSPSEIGSFYFAVQFSMLAGAMAGPVLAGRMGLVRTIVFTQLASIPFMLTLSHSYILWLAAIAFVVRGGLMNLGVPIVTNFAMEMSEKQEQGLMNALLKISWTSAWMISAAVGGLCIEAYGYTTTMDIAVLLYLASSAVFFVFFRQSETKGDGGSGWTMIRQNTV